MSADAREMDLLIVDFFTARDMASELGGVHPSFGVLAAHVVLGKLDDALGLKTRVFPVY